MPTLSSLTVNYQQFVLDNGSAACFARFIVYKQDFYVGYILCEYQLLSLNIFIKPKLEVVILLLNSTNLLQCILKKDHLIWQCRPRNLFCCELLGYSIGVQRKITQIQMKMSNVNQVKTFKELSWKFTSVQLWFSLVKFLIFSCEQSLTAY